MISTWSNITKSPISIHKKTVVFKTTPKFSITPEQFRSKLNLRQQITLNQIPSPITSLKKIPIPYSKKKSRIDDPLLLYSPFILGSPVPKGFKKFLDGEVDQCEMLKSQVKQNSRQSDVFAFGPRKSKVKRGKTIYIKNQKENEEVIPSKLKKLQKLIETKILKKQLQQTTQSQKKSEIVNIIQEKKPIQLSSSVKKFKQMQMLFIPKNPIEQDHETLSYSKLKLINESNDLMKKIQDEQTLRNFNKYNLRDKEKKFIGQYKKEKNSNHLKNVEYYPQEQSTLSQKDTALYNYLREQNCIDGRSLYANQQVSKSSQSTRRSILSNHRKRQPLGQQKIKPNQNNDSCISADLSLQSVYEYFLDDLYTEQKKLESKLNFQQAFNADLDKQMKTINKMKNINSRVIDCSLNKLFETL
ncbi:unnamed protein product [Paramecium pentaurelia]|uniref:Uncharacterized protein n=1 Tax=Paramecium pentaurelia TaxID=43138 RepID=A0A8S1VRV7_9CILI|nr:unnamed protein product [Paramecium pentaurelia]